MKLTIDTKVLDKYNLSLGQFMVLLTSYYSWDCNRLTKELEEMGLVQADLFRGYPPVLSDNTKDLVASILVECSPKLAECKIDFEGLAKSLQAIYPEGIKSGTTYEWQGTVDDIVRKLRTLVVKYDFQFTEQEAIRATQEYVSSFGKDQTHMKLLKYFLLKTTKTEGHTEVDSMFMTIIENNRLNEKE